MPKWLLRIIALFNRATTVVSNAGDKVQDKAVDVAHRTAIKKFNNTIIGLQHNTADAYHRLALAKAAEVDGGKRASDVLADTRNSIFAIAEKGSRK